MLEINKGRLQIKSWCNAPESGAIDQAVNLANHPVTVGHVALMSDTHQGNGMCIGGVVALKDSVSPNMVGSDISCGMLAVKTNLKREQLDKETLSKIIFQIKRDVPMGFNRHKEITSERRKMAEAIVSSYFEIED
jgi:tRNA-splicing ligase RtcB